MFQVRSIRRAEIAGAMAAFLLLLPAHARAQSPPTPAPRPPACSGPEFLQFDFWLGEWEVRDTSGTVVGHNRIERAGGSCGLLEQWQGTTGPAGKSLNFYDPSDLQWHQVWVGGGGMILRLDGKFENGTMTLSGHRGTPEVLHRIAWTPLPDGRVSQHWTYSQDGGKTWQEAFLGFYSRM